MFCRISLEFYFPKLFLKMNYSLQMYPRQQINFAKYVTEVVSDDLR